MLQKKRLIQLLIVDARDFGSLSPAPKGPLWGAETKGAAGLFAATVGCFTFAGAWPFAVLFAHPGTEIARSAE